MSIKAKFPGFCPLCNQRFIVGESDIEKKPNGKWAHVRCSPRPASIYDVLSSSSKISRNVPLSIEDNPIINEASMDDLSSMINNLSAPVETVQEEKVFTLSVYQKAIKQAIEDMVNKVYQWRHLVVEAVAGSGKTTTLVMMLKIIPEEFKVAFIAYNKHIANTLKERAPSYVHVSTLHSLGLEVIRANFPKVKVDKDGTKLNDIMNDLFPVMKSLVEADKLTKEERAINYKKRASMRVLVSMIMATLTDPEDVLTILETIDNYGLEVDASFAMELIEKLPEVLEKIKANPSLVSFDEMIWLPIVLNMSFIKFDFVMGDEWQDFNASMIEFSLRSVSADGHIIAVGDRKQSLYGFRFADVLAIPRTIERLQANTLPLSVTYRCPTSHVDLAKEYVPQLEAREDAPVGTVDVIEYKSLVPMLENGDLIICRTNAPLVAPAFECIRQHKKAIIRGRDGIGNQLISLINRFQTDNLSEFEINLTEYYNAEFQRLIDHGKELPAAMLTDKVATLKFIMEECSTVKDLIRKIDELFNDKDEGIVFSSIHRAKGLEAERIFFLGPEIVPHPKAKKDWELEQEDNMKYVALTRSKDAMYFITLPEVKKSKKGGGAK